MAENVGSVEVDIGADISGFAKGIKQVIGDLGGLSSLAAGISITGFLGKGLAEAMDFQGEMAQINALLKTTGGVSGMTADSLGRLAQKMQETTKYSDTEVLSAEKVALTFKSIGRDIFPDVISTAGDIAQVFGGDLQGATTQLSKALENPIQGMSALRREGVTFSTAQEKVIRQMVNTGHLLDAQKYMLSAIKGQVEGTAEAYGTTAAGKMAIFNHALDDAAKSFGELLLPVLSLGIDVAKGVADAISGLDPAFKIAILGAAGLAIAFSPLVAAMLPIIAPIALITGAVLLLDKAWKDNFGGIRTSVTGLFNVVKPELDKIGSAIKGFFSALSNPDFSAADRGLAKKLGESLPAESDFGTKLSKAIDEAWPQISTAISGIGAKLTPIISKVFSDAANSVKTSFQADLQTKVLDAFNNLNLGQGISTFQTTFGPGGTLQTTLTPFITTWSNTFGTNGSLATGVTNAVTGIGTALSGINFDAISSSLTTAFGPGGSIQKAIQPFSDFLGTITTTASGIGTTIQTSIETVAAWLGKDGLTKLTTAFDAIKTGAEGILNQIGGAIVDGIKSALQKILSALGNALSGIPGLSGVISGLQGAIAGLAGGGPAMAGAIYQVGEGNKPELFKSGGRLYMIPGDNGQVIPNSGIGAATAGRSSGGGQTFNIQNLTLQGVTNVKDLYDKLGAEGNKRSSGARWSLT